MTDILKDMDSGFKIPDARPEDVASNLRNEEVFKKLKRVECAYNPGDSDARPRVYVPMRKVERIAEKSSNYHLGVRLKNLQNIVAKVFGEKFAKDGMIRKMGIAYVIEIPGASTENQAQELIALIDQAAK